MYCDCTHLVDPEIIWNIKFLPLYLYLSECTSFIAVL